MIITERFKSGREFAEKYAGYLLRFTHPRSVFRLNVFEGTVFGFRAVGKNTVAMCVCEKRNSSVLSLGCYNLSALTLLQPCPNGTDPVFSYFPSDNCEIEIIKESIQTRLEYIRNLRKRINA